MKSYKSFTKHKDKPLGLRSRCKACESKARQDKKEKLGDVLELKVEEKPPAMQKKAKKKESHIGLSGTAICAACGERKPVFEFDKARQKPFTLKCHSCTEANAPLMSKHCCSCEMELPLDHFYRDSYTKAGFRPRCMECMKARKGTGVDLPVIEEEAEIGQVNEGLDDNGDFYFPTVKPTRSKRNRRKSQKTREPDFMTLDDEIGEAPESRRRVFREKKSSKRSRRVTDDRCDPSGEADGQGKLAALSSLSVRPTEELRKGEGSERGGGNGKATKQKRLTGCSTVKDKQGNVTKCCTGCWHFKKASEFGRDVSKPSGLRSRCRQCQKRGRDGTPNGGVEEKTSNADVVRKKIPRKPQRKKTAIVEKVCSRCDHQKPVGEFYRDKSKEDSYASICKKCAKEAKNKTEKSMEKRTTANSMNKSTRQGHVQDVDDADMEIVLNYVDALLPESSACSADPGDEDEEAMMVEMTSAQHRVCVGCDVDKNWIEFEANPLLPDGLCPLCKECRRGNGMAGRRLSHQKLRRCCVRCGRSKSAMHFVKSIFYPNRTTRICQKCRDEEEDLRLVGTPRTNKRRRVTHGYQEVVDLIDFDCDALRVRDPGGGEHLWNASCADSDTERDSDEPSRPMSHRRFTSESVLNTQLKSDGPKGVTITHHVPSRCEMVPTSLEKFDGNNFVWNGYHLKSTKMTQLMEKQCKRCGEMKSRECYYLDDSQPSNLSSHCIECCAKTVTKGFY